MASATVRALVASLMACCLAGAQQEPRPATASRLNLVIVEGEGAINNIKLRTSRNTIVQVEDENHRPIAGAAVTFLLPIDGPGGAFAGGAKSATLVSDSAGRVTMPRLQLNQNPGSYTIRVSASHQGLNASTVIGQSTIAGAAGLSSAGLIAIIAGVAAAGGVAAVVASRGGNNSNPTSPPTTTAPSGTISAGSGAVFGPPR
jgi:hypothetical protein